ncbi:MAG: transcriptional regulator [Methanobacterium sp.]|nr:transcriptional regulator [Methanobacterium sp.]
MSGIPMHRDQVLIEITELLSNHGFETSNIYDRSCFDMVARRELILLLLKVLINVDGFSSQQAQEIKRLAHTFLASPLIVGFKSKTEPLEEDVVYERHGIPVVAPETLRNMVVDDVYPEILADRGGYYVNIDGDAIKEMRMKQNLSLKDVADIAHVSRETIYKYEHGIVRAVPETAMILESILNMKITLSIDPFKVPDTKSDIIKSKESNKEADKSNNQELNQKEPKELIKLGFGVIPTNKTPFDAIAQTNYKKTAEKQNTLLTNLEKNRNKKILKKMALNIKDLSDITKKEAVFIMESKRIIECIEGIPAVNIGEICEMENCREFIRLLKERKN